MSRSLILVVCALFAATAGCKKDTPTQAVPVVPDIPQVPVAWPSMVNDVA